MWRIYTVNFKSTKRGARADGSPCTYLEKIQVANQFENNPNLFSIVFPVHESKKTGKTWRHEKVPPDLKICKL